MRLYREVVELRCDESFKAWSHGLPYETVKWHFHPEYEIHLVTSTSGRTFVGDYVGRFAPGNLAFLGPNLPHNWVSDVAPGEIVAQRGLVVQFGDGFIRRAIESFPELRPATVLLDESLGGLEYDEAAAEAALPLMTALQTAQGIARLELFFGLMRVLATCGRRRRLSSVHYQPCARDYVHKALEHVLLHIDRDLAGNIRESQMAALAGYTQSSFSRAFRRQTGQSFVHYINEKRIARSCDLLLHTNGSIIEICFQVGFKNVSNFNRQFLLHRKITPSAWRRAHRLAEAQGLAQTRAA
ncbi:AraC family transcriptional regulator [Lichenicoccus sp.]|uniref:AraC family transcriptional regulator n=1 Tax=Lichenicoccus sp. TaxID=2781899 RepID=UPI003D145D19